MSRLSRWRFLVRDWRTGQFRLAAVVQGATREDALAAVRQTPVRRCLGFAAADLRLEPELETPARE